MSRPSFEQSRRGGGSNGNSLKTLVYRQQEDLSVNTSFGSLSHASPATLAHNQQQQQVHQYETGSYVESEASSNYRYRNDYSRSQHSQIVIPDESPQNSDSNRQQQVPYYHEESTLPLSPEQIRFEKYVNRFAAHDPRSSPVRRCMPSGGGSSISERISRFNKPNTGGAKSIHSAPAAATSTKDGQTYFSFPDPQLSFSDASDPPVQMSGQLQQQHLYHQSSPSQLLGGASPMMVSRKLTNGSETDTTATSHTTATEHQRSRGSPSLERNSSSSSVPMTSSRYGARPRAPVASQPSAVAPSNFANRSCSHDERRSSYEGQSHQAIEESDYEAHQQQLQHEPVVAYYDTTPTKGRRSQRTIETPSPARVTELRSRLWDTNETLKVTVQPSLHYVRRGGAVPAADDEAPRDSSDEDDQMVVSDNEGTTEMEPKAIPAATAAHRPEMAARSGQRVSRSLSPNRPQYRNSAFKSRFYEAALASRRQARNAPTTPTVASVQKRDRVEQERMQAEEDGATTKVQQPRAIQPPTTPRRNMWRPPSTGDNEAMREQVHYEPQAPTTPRNNMWRQAETTPRGTSIPPQERRRPLSTCDERPNEAMQQQVHSEPQAPTTPRNNMWRQAETSPHGSSISPKEQREVWRNQPSSVDERSEGTGEASVAKLVARLNSINRENPAAALAQIDSILRAESKSSSDDQRNSVLAASAMKHRQLQQQPMNLQEEKEDEDVDDSDSDGGTSVSSITNPTYAGVGGSQKNVHDQLLMASNRRAKPNALQNYQPAPGTAEQQQRKSKKDRNLAIPFDTIALKGSGNMDKGAPAVGRLDQHVSESLSDPSNAAAIAMKIRTWDELSGSETGKSKTFEEGEIISAATDDLGSIMTPSSTVVGGVASAANAPASMLNLPERVESYEHTSPERHSPVGYVGPRRSPIASPQSIRSPEEISGGDMQQQRGRSFEREQSPSRERSQTLSITPRRCHPWDHYHPRNKPSPSPTRNPRTIDTSMENGEGIELKPIEPAPVSQPQPMSPMRKETIVDSAPIERTRSRSQPRKETISDPEPHNRTRSSSQPRYEAAAEAAPIIYPRSAAQSCQEAIARYEVPISRSAVPPNSDLDFEFSGNDFAVHPQLLRPNDEFDFPTRIKQQGPAQTAKLSADCDAAWVSLPPSAFGSERKISPPPRPTTRDVETPLQRRLSDRRQRMGVSQPQQQPSPRRDAVQDLVGNSRPETPPLLAYSESLSASDEHISINEVPKSPRRRKFSLLKMRKSHDAEHNTSHHDDVMVPIVTRSVSKSPGRRRASPSNRRASPSGRRPSPSGRERNGSGSFNIVEKFNRLRRSHIIESRTDED